MCGIQSSYKTSYFHPCIPFLLMLLLLWSIHQNEFLFIWQFHSATSNVNYLLIIFWESVLRNVEGMISKNIDLHIFVYLYLTNIPKYGEVQSVQFSDKYLIFYLVILNCKYVNQFNWIYPLLHVTSSRKVFNCLGWH